MSNRAERRRRMRLGGRPGELTGGPVVEARHKYNAPIPDPAPGEHLWVVVGSWWVADPAAVFEDVTHLDLENLMTIDGPGCYVCEQVWSPTVGARPCPGEPSSDGSSQS